MKLGEIRLHNWGAAILRSVCFAAALMVVFSTSMQAQQVMPSPSTPVVAAPSTDLEPQVIIIPLNKAHLVNLPLPARDVIVGQPEIADIIVKTPRQAYMVARAIGETNVFFVGASGDVILHLVVRVDIDLASAQTALETLIPKGNFKLTSLNGDMVLEGTVPSAREASDAVRIIQGLVPKGTNIVNMTRILGDMQVMLKVRIAEIQRTIAKELGVSATIGPRVLGKDFNMSFAGHNANQTGQGTISVNAFDIGTIQFSTLEAHRLTKTLAEPVLTVVSGETANFLAGGQLPVPSGTDENGNAIFTLQDFGVGLSFTPFILANNNINLRIVAEESSISADASVTINNTTLSGLATRRVESTVTLPSGGSIMIAGLMKDTDTNLVNGYPWLKDIPILGAMFRSEDFDNSRSELIIMVTAYIVKPVEFSGQLSLPTDGFVPASEVDMYLLGRLHKQYGNSTKSQKINSLLGPFGYVME